MAVLLVSDSTIKDEAAGLVGGASAFNIATSEGPWWETVAEI